MGGRFAHQRTAGILPGFDEPDEDATVSPKPNLMVLFNPALDIHSQTVLDLRGVSGPLREILPQCVAPTESLAQALHIPSHLTSDVPPLWVWYGTADPIYRFAQGFLARARELGCRMVLQMTEGAHHGYYNDYLLVYRETLDGMVEFLAA